MMVAWAVGALMVIVGIPVLVMPLALGRVAEPWMVVVIRDGLFQGFIRRSRRREENRQGGAPSDKHAHRS